VSAGWFPAGRYSARDARLQLRTNYWLFAAALSFVAATAALRYRSVVPWALAALAVALTLALFALAIRSYLTFLHGADELLRKIQTEALALGFAVGAAFSMLYPLLQGLGAPELGSHATPMVMISCWALGSWLGERRYAQDAAGDED
jgi:hypothetical protein